MYKQGQYNLKDKKAMVYKLTYSVDSIGQHITKYKPISATNLWCYTNQLSQDMTLRASVYGAEETRFFVFNNHADILVGGYIEYKGEWYEITRRDTTDDYNTDIVAYARDRIAPRPSDIDPYTPPNTSN